MLLGIRESFWFVPALLVLGCTTLALVMVEVDARLPPSYFAAMPKLFGAGAEGSRALLSAIATSTMTVAGVVFSINIVALSLAAAQYSPHVLQNYMRDRTNQTVLGIFLGIYTYCLIVLRTVRGGDEVFVPAASIAAGILLALLGVSFLIFFIHHVAVSIRISHIVSQIAAETRGVIERLHPEGVSCSHMEDAAETVYGEAAHRGAPGYVEHIDYDALADRIASSGGTLHVKVAVGDFVLPGEALAVWRGGPLNEDAVRRAIAVGDSRNIDQDVAFGLQQLVDIALRALSPSNNDTTTAVHALQHLTALLGMLATRDLGPKGVVTRDGRAVLEFARPRFEDFVRSVVEPFRREASGNVAVVHSLVTALSRIGAAAAAAGPEALAAVMRQLDALGEAVRGQAFDGVDATLLQAAIADATQGLEALSGRRDRGCPE